eukprot:293999-Chlamydomonas_euryale.AAC.4
MRHVSGGGAAAAARARRTLPRAGGCLTPAAHLPHRRWRHQGSVAMVSTCASQWSRQMLAVVIARVARVRRAVASWRAPHASPAPPSRSDRGGGGDDVAASHRTDCRRRGVTPALPARLPQYIIACRALPPSIARRPPAARFALRVAHSPSPPPLLPTFCLTPLFGDSSPCMPAPRPTRMRTRAAVSPGRRRASRERNPPRQVRI